MLTPAQAFALVRAEQQRSAAAEYVQEMVKLSRAVAVAWQYRARASTPEAIASCNVAVRNAEDAFEEARQRKPPECITQREAKPGPVGS
jgi:hypothetical protein